MTEFLSKDVLYEGFIQSFTPFHRLQMLLGSCRVDARHCFVTAPTVWQKLYSGVLLIAKTMSFILFVLFYPSKVNHLRSLLHLFRTIVGLHNLLGLSNIIHVRFINNEENIKFFIQLHEIDKRMKIDRKAYVHDVFFKVNVAMVAFWTAVPTCLLLAIFAADWLEGVYNIWIFYSHLTCAIEWVYFSNVIVYFYMRLRYINSIMINYLGIEDSSYLKMYEFIRHLHKTSLKELAAETSDFVTSDTDVYLKVVFDALLRFTSLFRFQMFIFCFKFTILSILSVEFSVLVFQANIDVGMNRFIAPSFWFADFLILVTICFRWDEFYRELDETKNLATKILAKHSTGPLRKKANTMIKLIEENPPHFSVYEMWNMDASTMLIMFDVLTTLIITVMQFTLL